MSHAVAVCWLVTSAAAAHGDAPSHVKGDAPSRAKELLNTVHNTLNNIVGLATELKVASTTESTTTRTEGSAKLDHIISQAMSAQSSVASLFMHPGTALHRQPQQAHSPLHGTADYPEAHRHSRNTQHSTVHTGRRGHSLSTPGNLSASADPWASSIDEGSAAAAAAPTPAGSSAGHSALLLPFCVDGDPQQVSLSCTQIAGAAAGLCAGLLRIQQASCAQLSDHAFVQSLVERVGLTPDGRGSALYGKAAASIVPVHGKSAKHKVGLWQNPMQIAAALIHVGSRVAVHRYIEVGVYTAWTCGFVSTFLRRVGTPGAFRAHAVDITHSAIATGTRTLLPRINVSYISRDKLVLPPEHPFYDFCFIDGDHRYSGVLRDYDAFSPSCTYMMFHDIQDTSTLHLGNFSGGVPLFWAHLRAHVRPSRLAEFTHQPPEVPFPTFGLGVVAPNEQRTSAPDVAVSQWPHWSDFDSGDASAEPLARELCRFNHTRLCQMGAHGILNGQKAHLWAAKKSS